MKLRVRDAYTLLLAFGLVAGSVHAGAQETKADAKPSGNSSDVKTISKQTMQHDHMPDMKKPPKEKVNKGRMQGIPGMPDKGQGQKDNMNGMEGHKMPGMDMGEMHGMMAPIGGVPETQMASGTSWQPTSTPMFGIHKMSGRWSLMTHYNIFLSYDRQDGPRGDYQYNSTNWLMLMAQRPVHNDRLTLRAMLSLEPLTVTPRGFPLLFQSGEQYKGQPLVDRQHPHDLFMELSARYTHPVGKDGAVFLYAAPSGEPALGPTAFPHRLSAADNPVAPISHHWQDSSHIEFGVLTIGAWKRNVQLEGSYFTGREPDPMA